MAGNRGTPRDRTSEREALNVLNHIRSRRSSSKLRHPGPTRSEISQIISAAISAPDHGSLRPWRFVVFTDDSRTRFGEILAEALERRLAQAEKTALPSQVEKERNKLLRAPVIIAVIARIDRDAAIPAIEQFAAVAAACQNILLSSSSLGYGSMWRTGEPSYDPWIKKQLGAQEHDMIAGWIYLGTPEATSERRRNDGPIEEYLSYWD